jgi:hypothetical protein
MTSIENEAVIVGHCLSRDRIDRLNFRFNFRAMRIQDGFEVMARLKVHPEFRRGAKKPAKPDGGIRADRAALADDFRDTCLRNANRLG